MSCAPCGQEGRPSEVTDEEIAATAKALGHPARIQICRSLAHRDECPGPELFREVDLAQSTVSEHLRVLKEAGIITCRREGTTMIYRLVPEVVRSYSDEVAWICSAAEIWGPGRAAEDAGGRRRKKAAKER
jgi:ArsR family transcriptional regulator